MNINRKTTVLILLSLTMGLAFGWLIFGNTSSRAPEAEHQYETEIAGETLWTCSMHPQVRQNEPGSCPICGMDLIPLESEENGELDPRAITMSPTAMQLADVSTALVSTATPVKSLRLNGKVQEDERLIFSQTSHIPGRIERLQVNFTGEYVRKGEVIAFLYSPELVTAQEELFEAHKIRKNQPALYLSAQEKLKNWKLSQTQIDQILEYGEAKEQFPIVADVSGYVTRKNVNLGDYVRKGESLYQIADLSEVWVLFDVYESDLPWINKGDRVRFTVASLPGKDFEGQISFLDPVIDPKTRVAKARVEMPNQGNVLKPEMFVSGAVQAALENKMNAPIVPKTAVMWTGERSVVYIKTPSYKGTHFIMREVVLGPELGDDFIVKEGLEPGEEIAVHGTFSIDAAAQLAGKPSMMNPKGGPAASGHNHGGGEIPSKVSSMKPKTVQFFSIDQKAKKALQSLYTPYRDFKNALVDDQLTTAKQSAGHLEEAIDKVDISLFKEAAHDAWMEHKRKLKSALQHMQHFKKLGEVRQTFQQVSHEMIALSKAFKPMDLPLYVKHCPMANNKGADWLSIQVEIKNPYQGEAMLTCGEITDTIE